MPNVTVHVSETAYREARIWCAAHDTSLSATVQLCIENLPNMRVRPDGSIAVVTKFIKPPFPRLRTLEDVYRAQAAADAEARAAYENRRL